MGVAVAPSRRVFPQRCVVPMGWTWALSLVQAAHEQILDATELFRPGRRAVDFRPPPSPSDGVLHSLYVDNIIVAGESMQEVTAARRAASAALVAAGLPVHDETDAGSHLEVLGVELAGDPPTVQVAPKKYWRLYLGLG